MIEAFLRTKAVFSADRVYRYTLARRLSPPLVRGDRVCMFVGLNPSTADEVQNDPTIRRCMGFAQDWGYNIYLMGNVYAYRSTDPKVLKIVKEPVGFQNVDWIRDMATHSDLIVAAWGGNELHSGAERIAEWLLGLDKTRCLGRNKDRSPKHPLYLSKETKLRRIT